MNIMQPSPTLNDLVVELHSASFVGGAVPAQLLFGGNSSGTAPAYIKAPLCGCSEPTNLATYGSGFPNLAVVATVIGNGISEQILIDGFDGN